MLTGLIVAAAAAIPAALITLLVNAKRFSGKIKSSEAVTLWTAQEEFRKDLMKRNDQLRERLDGCEKIISGLNQRLDEVEEINAELHLENGELQKKLKEYDKVIGDLREQVSRLEEHNLQLEADNLKLRARVKELEDHNG